MVKYKWNISKEEAQTIVFSNLKDIFSYEKTNQLELNDLIKKLLIKTNYGSFIDLLDTNHDYGIRYIGDKTYIYYFDDLDDWELI